MGGEPGAVGDGSLGQTVEEVDPGVAQEGVAHRQSLGRLERARRAAAEGEGLRPRDMARERHELRAIVHQRLQRRARPVPFEHREFGGVQRAAFAIPEDMRQAEDARLAGGQELLHGEFGRGMEPRLLRGSVRADEFGLEPDEMGLVAGRRLERGRIDLDEALGVEPLPHGRGDPRAQDEARAPGGVAVAGPEGFSGWTQGAFELFGLMRPPKPSPLAGEGAPKGRMKASAACVWPLPPKPV